MSRKLNGSAFPMVDPSSLNFFNGAANCDHDYPAQTLTFEPGVLERHVIHGVGIHPAPIMYHFFCSECGGFLAGRVYPEMESAMGIGGR